MPLCFNFMWKREQPNKLQELFRESKKELNASLRRLDVFHAFKQILKNNSKACSEGYYSKIQYDEELFVELCLKADLCPRTAKFLMLGEVSIWRDKKAREKTEKTKLRLVA